MNNDEIEIIDDLEESSVSVETNEQPDTNVNNEVVKNETSSETVSENKESVSEGVETLETLDIVPNANTVTSNEEPVNNVLNDSAFKIVDNNPIIDPTKDTSAPKEVKEEASVSDTNNGPQEETKEEPVNNVLNDSAFKIVDNSPIIDPTKDTSAPKEGVKEEVVQNTPTTSEQVAVDNNTPQEENNVIVPNENVTPQEIINEPVVEESVSEEVTPETPVSEPVSADTQIKEEVNNSPVASDAQQTSVQPEANEIPQSDVVDIKETSTIQNQAGTTVIGQINGDSVSTVSNEMPNSIDISAKEAAKAVETKTKQVKVKTPRQKITSAIITIVVLLILGGGGYFGYNYFMQNNVTFEAKNVEFDLGQEIPKEVSYYINSSKPIVNGEYSIDLSNVGEDIGTYQYTITRKNDTKTGTITIGDTKGPVITFKENLMFSKNDVITKDDLVSKCEDISNCTYELEAAIDTSVAGSQEVGVVAEDDLGNQSNEKTSISIISKSLSCKGEETLSQDGTYNERLEDVFYFDDENKLISSVGKKVVTFVDYGSYFALLNDESVADKYNFDRKTFSYWISNDILYNEGQSLEDIQTYYTTNNYTCS